jgi:hypothetical protein
VYILAIIFISSPKCKFVVLIVSHLQRKVHPLLKKADIYAKIYRKEAQWFLTFPFGEGGPRSGG